MEAIVSSKDAATNAADLNTSISETTPNGQLLFLWMSRQDICRHLSIAPHTLFRLVEQGAVAADLSGDRPRYRLAQPLDKSLEEPEPAPIAQADFPPLAARPRTASRSEEDREYADALVGLVDQLTERLVASERRNVRLERERDEAVSLARRLAREGDGLTRQLNAYCRSLVESNCALSDANDLSRGLRDTLDAIARELHALASSPLALPIRGRLSELVAAAQPPLTI